MTMPVLSAVTVRVRVVFFLVLALLSAASDSAASGRTLAYFTSRASTVGQTMGTVNLDVSTAPSVSGVFNIAANMLPGDFQLRTFEVTNNGSAGVAQQAFTYSVASTSTGPGNVCSLLDSQDPPGCSIAAAPSATADTGAALLLLRCTSDSAASVPADCGSPAVFVTQVFPSAGAGTQHQLAGGLSRAAIAGVASGGAYSIEIGGTSFAGGPLVISAPYGMGGPDSVPGADGQSAGLLAGETDRLASVVYLPTQAGPNLADQTSVLTFTWTATQRVGGTR
jgi:hypothetical protein